MLNESGQVAFRGSLTGGSSASGVFVGAPGAVQAAALENTAAPGGGTFGNPFGSTFDTFVLNGSGQVAVLANLTGAGVTGADDQGLYAGSAGGLVKVVREGDQVDVDPGPGVVLRTVGNAGIGFFGNSGGQDGGRVTFTDTGLLTYRLGFTDGSVGIFVSSIMPVPEPGTLILGGAAAVGLLCPRLLSRRRIRTECR